MIRQAPLRLSTTEWDVVRHAMAEAADCGCTRPNPGLFARTLTRLAGRRTPDRIASTRTQTLAAYVCASWERGRPADDLAPLLAAQGFNEREIGAIGLLAA
jgi:hypothetical protein